MSLFITNKNFILLNNKCSQQFLFNNYYTYFTGHNVMYKSSTHYFVKMKQELFESSNRKLAQQILNERDPYIVQLMGHDIKNYNSKLWSQVKYNHMLSGLKYKFSQNNALCHKLLETDNQFIIYTSPNKFWGIGIDEYELDNLQLKKWKGQNLLGSALMETRSYLKNINN